MPSGEVRKKKKYKKVYKKNYRRLHSPLLSSTENEKASS